MAIQNFGRQWTNFKDLNRRSACGKDGFNLPVNSVTINVQNNFSIGLKLVITVEAMTMILQLFKDAKTNLLYHPQVQQKHTTMTYISINQIFIMGQLSSHARKYSRPISDKAHTELHKDTFYDIIFIDDLFLPLLHYALPHVTLHLNTIPYLTLHWPT